MSQVQGSADERRPEDSAGEELDLTGDAPAPGPSGESRALEVRPYSLARQREDMRGKIAAGLVVLLAFVVAGAFGTLWVAGELTEGVKDVLTLVLGPVATLVGSATGYYFGGQTGATEYRDQGDPGSGG